MRTILVVVACLTIAPGTSPTAGATGASARYVASGTVVVNALGTNVVDQGILACDDSNGAGVGGFCVPFGGGDAIGVADAAIGPDGVAFQVCVDNSGDGLCTTPDVFASNDSCQDQVFFSHHSGSPARNDNPIGPLPTEADFCDIDDPRQYDGYVVFLCTGEHVDSSGQHTHPATTGIGTVTTGGEGNGGDFCGGVAVAVKPYIATRQPEDQNRAGARDGACAHTAMRDPAPDADDDAMTGQVTGGPLFWDRSFWLHCHVQVDDSTHAGPVTPGGDVHSPSDPHDGDAEDDEVAIAAALVNYAAPLASQIYLCTSVSWPNADGPNWLYWHAGNDGPDGVPGGADDVTGHWATSTTTPCSPSV